MKRLIPYLLIVGLSLIACKKEENVISNAAIDAGTRAIIKRKNDSLILGLTTGQKRVFKGIADEHFMKNLQVQTNSIYRFFMYGKLGQNYTVYDEYEVRDRKTGEFTEVRNDKKGYTFSYSAPGHTSYVSIMQFKMGNDTGALASIYALEGTTWKLDAVDAFLIAADGKTPVEMYKSAQKAEEKGEIYEASYYAVNAARIIEMYENSKFKYNDAKVILLYKKKIEENIPGREEYPHVLKDIATKPEIISIFMQPDKAGKGMKYTITYQTTVPVYELEKLAAEYKKVKPAAQKFYPGINFKKTKVEFKAVNVENNQFIVNSHVFTE